MDIEIFRQSRYLDTFYRKHRMLVIADEMLYSIIHGDKLDFIKGDAPC